MHQDTDQSFVLKQREADKAVLKCAVGIEGLIYHINRKFMSELQKRAFAL